MVIRLTKPQRLMVIIAISLSFFLTEIGVGFYTRSLALVADAFHYLNDLIGFVIALLAFKIEERSDSPRNLSFGWQRATLLGAFSNGIFLLALGVSIFIQAIQRFVSLQKMENPKLVLIVGCVGLTLNIISAVFLHEHDEDIKRIIHTEDGDNVAVSNMVHVAHRHETVPNKEGTSGQGHDHSHDLGMMGVLVHVLGDAANNVGVIIAAAVIWKARYEGRFYADPAVSVGIAIVIFLSSLPLVKKTGTILMQTVPRGVDPLDVKHDLETIPGVLAVHELHIWRLNQRKAIASAHVVVSCDTVSNFMTLAATINQCFHAYGIHSATIQPEVQTSRPASALDSLSSAVQLKGGGHVVELQRRATNESYDCMIKCPTVTCEALTCCG